MHDEQVLRLASQDIASRNSQRLLRKLCGSRKKSRCFSHAHFFLRKSRTFHYSLLTIHCLSPCYRVFPKTSTRTPAQIIPSTQAYGLLPSFASQNSRYSLFIIPCPLPLSTAKSIPLQPRHFTPPMLEFRLKFKRAL